MIVNALQDKELPVYGDGLNIREWIHVNDHCRAIDLVFHHGKPGEIYNIGGGNERPNIELVRLILKELGKPETLISYVEDRPGHDRRYAVNSTKIMTTLGWLPEISFEIGLKETIRWYQENQSWWRNIQSEKYQSIHVKAE
jgi:dTDP-glucose 4,6-dehydratase